MNESKICWPIQCPVSTAKSRSPARRSLSMISILAANLLYAEIVESPHPHALIKKIDKSKAEKVPGVVKVVTGKDFPYRFGLYMHDRYIFAQDRVRFVGEQVAAVIARDARTAKKRCSTGEN